MLAHVHARVHALHGFAQKSSARRLMGVEHQDVQCARRHKRREIPLG